MQITNETGETITLEPGEGIDVSLVTRSVLQRTYRLELHERPNDGIGGPMPVDELADKDEIARTRVKGNIPFLGEVPDDV